MQFFVVLFSDDFDADMLRKGFQTLNDGICNVLNDVFNCDRFATELLMNFHDNHIRVCLEILKQLLQLSTVDNSHYLNCVNIEQKNIIHHVINDCIPEGKCRMKISFNLKKNLLLFN